jgi:hypothetical protein
MPGLGRAGRHARHLAPSFAVDAEGDDDRGRDDPAAAVDHAAGGVDPPVGPVAFDRPVEEGLHLAVDRRAPAADPARREAGASS